MAKLWMLRNMVRSTAAMLKVIQMRSIATRTQHGKFVAADLDAGTRWRSATC